jgi:hypothetical protein
MISPLYGQLSPLRVPTKAVRRVQDSDAITYISAVEIADGQSLEDSVKYAYEDFILGCKADSIWTAIKASCILAGARTLSGALVPLVGTAPTNFNFVTADFDRKLGLKGNRSTKSLNSNRNNNADPQNSKHLYARGTTDTLTRSGNSTLIGTGSGTGGSGLIIGPSGSSAYFRANFSTDATTANAATPNKFGVSRFSSTQVSTLLNSTISTKSSTSTTPLNSNILLFNGLSYTDARIAYYSIGESLDLAKLDTRVSTLMTDLAAAIP